MILAWARSRREWIEHWAGLIGWVGLGIVTFLWLALAHFQTDNLYLFAMIAIVLFLGLCLCSFFLVLRYRHFFCRWYGLMGLVVVLAVMNWGRYLDIEIISSLFLMGMVAVIVALPVSMLLVLWRPDVSIEFLGLILIVFLWCSLIISVPYGGPVRAWVLYSTKQATGQFWWLETLACILMLGAPLGGLAFLIHFIRLIINEVRGV